MTEAMGNPHASFIIVFGQLMASYFLGSISFAYLLGRYHSNIDLREHGSKNLGANNVSRGGRTDALPLIFFGLTRRPRASTFPVSAGWPRDGLLGICNRAAV